MKKCQRRSVWMTTSLDFSFFFYKGLVGFILFLGVVVLKFIFPSPSLAFSPISFSHWGQCPPPSSALGSFHVCWALAGMCWTEEVAAARGRWGGKKELLFTFWCLNGRLGFTQARKKAQSFKLIKRVEWREREREERNNQKQKRSLGHSKTSEIEGKTN